MCIPRSRVAGISLVELVIFIVVVGVAVAGVLSVMNITTRHSADPMVQKQALAIAESMLEEVALQNFTKPAGGFGGPFSLANRALFDSVDDYNGFATAGIYDLTGSAIPGLGGYSLLVAVTPSPVGPAGNQVPAAQARLIRVTVTDPRNQTVVISGYRTGYGP
jgi:MSHA pilin protein MshD